MNVSRHVAPDGGEGWVHARPIQYFGVTGAALRNPLRWSPPDGALIVFSRTVL